MFSWYFLFKIFNPESLIFVSQNLLQFFVFKYLFLGFPKFFHFKFLFSNVWFQIFFGNFSVQNFRTNFVFYKFICKHVYLNKFWYQKEWKIGASACGGFDWPTGQLVRIRLKGALLTGDHKLAASWFLHNSTLFLIF